MPLLNDIINVLDLFPIGYVYISTSPTSPMDLFGGQWEALPEGRVLLAQGTSYPAGSQGGEATHTLSVEELPAHSHVLGSNATVTLSGTVEEDGRHTHSYDMYENLRWMLDGAGGDMGFPTTNRNNYPDTGSVGYGGTHSHSLGTSAKATPGGSTDNTGSNSPHNNLPPYLSVYMWQRIA